MPCIQRPFTVQIGLSKTHQIKCLFGVSLLVLALMPAHAFAQQVVVKNGEESVIENGDVNAHTTADRGSTTANAVVVNDGYLDIRGSTVKILSEGAGANAIELNNYYNNGGGIKIVGDKDNRAQISTTGSNATAVWVSGNQTVGSRASLHLENTDIRASGVGAIGISSSGESSVTLIGSTVNASGMGVDVSGSYKKGNASLVLEGTDIHSINNSGIRVMDGTMRANNFNITSGWDSGTGMPAAINNAYGINANSRSYITLTNGRIETWAKFGNGIWAANDHTDTSDIRLRLSNVDIITHGENAPGIDHINVRSVIEGGSIYTYGFGSHGIGAGNGGVAGWAPSHVTLAGTKITTEGESAYGLVATTTSTIDAHGVNITTSGDGAIGARSHSTGRVTLSNGSSITTSGANAYGAAATFGSVIDISGTVIKTTGTNGSGVHLVGYNYTTPVNQHVNVAKIANSSVSAANGAALKVAGGFENTFSITNSQITGTGDDALLFHSIEYIYRDDQNTIPMSVGTVNLTAVSSRLEGDMLVDSGTVDISLESSSLHGALRESASGNMVNQFNIDATSRWQMTDTSVVNDLQNSGLIAFSVPVNDQFKTLNVEGDYTSNNGSFLLNARLGDDTSPSDRLIFKGEVSGTSKVSVNNAGGLGALTSGDGIQLIDAEKATQDAFEQDGRISAGAYDYTLFAGGKEGVFNGDWYLRSTYVSPVDPELPNYRSEVPLAMVAPALANRFGLAMLGTYNDRQNASTQKDSNFWVRMFGESGDIGSAGGSDQDRLNDFYHDGPSYSYKLGGIQVGVDLYRGETQNGSLNIGGLYAGVGRAEADVERVYGGDAGSAKLNGYSVGGYWTHLNSAGWYTDLVLQGTRFDPIRMDSTGNVGMRTQGWAGTSSLEAGYKLRLADGWGLEPQAQLIYQHVSLDNTQDMFGRFDFEDTNTVYSRIGARLTRDWTAADGRIYSAWVRANLWHTMSGGATTTFADLNGNNRVALNSDLGGTWGQLGLGISAQLKNNVSLFANGDYSHSLGQNGARSSIVSGNVGLKVKW